MNQTSLSLASGAALYGRVSTDKQATSTQEARCKEYVVWKRLPPLLAEFYDDDVSGSVAIWERPKGRLLHDRLRQGDIKHLVVAKLDRLGRSAIDLLKTVELLDSLNIILHIVDMGGDSLSTQGASGRLMFTVLAGMAEYERELIRSRIQDKLDVKRARGELTGTESYGWNAVLTGEVSPKDVAIRKLVDNAVEQGWILHMAALRSQGLSYGRIADDLNQRGVPTKLGAGKEIKYKGQIRLSSGLWQAGNVAKVLNSKTVLEWLRRQSGNQDQAAA